jgi:hypothetical protein
MGDIAAAHALPRPAPAHVIGQILIEAAVPADDEHVVVGDGAQRLVFELGHELDSSEAGGHLASMTMQAAYSTRPNLNSGTPWSELAIDDLRYGVEHGDTVAKIADFLCRSEEEVTEKIEELGLSPHGV